MAKPNVFVVEDYKLVMLGVPKCGQTSVKRAFVGKDVYNVHDRGNFNYLNFDEVEAYREKGYLTVTIVRNPYDRLFSFWKQKILKPNKFVRGASKPFYTGMPFTDVVREVCNTCDSASDVHFKSQVEQISFNGRFPEFIGRLENFQDDWNVISGLLGKTLPELPYENRTDYHKDEWTKALKNKVYTRYQRDFRILGYDK